MITLSEYFETAANDYLFLLGKGYPQKTILKMVGDRYQLGRHERSMLFRGIMPTNKCETRSRKRVADLPAGSELLIDGYNVIRTVGSYLTGLPVFIAMDGFMRDAAEMHRSTLKSKVLDKSLALLMHQFSTNLFKQVNIYLDEPVSKSGELSARINRLLKENEIPGHAKTVHSPDHHLKLFSTGFVCTSDSVVIDECRVAVFDLAQAILALNFKTNFINFETMNLIPKQ